MSDPEPALDPWTARYYDRGTAAFDRVIFFSDAVFAIAVTLVAVEIGVPELAGDVSNRGLAEGLLEKWPTLLAYAFTFGWVAFYWRANHRFSNTLRRMDGVYIGTVLLYLAFIALLPFPASTLGLYYNAVAVSFFLAFIACVSTMETVLLVVADRRDLFIKPITSPQRRQAILGSLSPVAGAVLAIPLTFVSVPVGVVAFVGLSIAFGALVNRMSPATW